MIEDPVGFVVRVAAAGFIFCFGWHAALFVMGTIVKTFRDIGGPKPTAAIAPSAPPAKPRGFQMSRRTIVGRSPEKTLH